MNNKNTKKQLICMQYIIQIKKTIAKAIVFYYMEAPTRFELVNKGFADLCLTTWLWCHIKKWSGLRGSNPLPPPWQGGALPDELNPLIYGASGRNRTNDTGIFSPLLYRLSYRGTHLATRMGLEPTTSSVTG